MIGKQANEVLQVLATPRLVRIPLAHLSLHGGQRDQQTKIVRLNAGIVGSAIAADLTARIAPLDQNVSLFGIGFAGNGTKNASAWICPVPRIDIDMQGAQAARTVIARGGTERQHLKPAIHAGKARIVFLKSLLFHIAYHLLCEGVLSDYTVDSFVSINCFDAARMIYR